MAKALDLVGKKYGKLTVISRAENNKNGNTMWLCDCDCGGEKVALGYDLTHGRTTTCGCGSTGKPSHNRISLIGRKYGRLTVKSLNDDRSQNGILYWNCVCDCGKKVVMSGGNLKSKENPSHSGCPFRKRPYNFKDLSGKRFGRLVVLTLSNKRDSNGRLLWECICDCGNKKTTTSDSLNSGHVKSCGCMLMEQRKKAKKITHGMTNTRIYKLYRGMLLRCSPTYHGAKNYYDKGIVVCDEWLGENGFKNFYKWAIDNGYDDSKPWTEMTIDRIDVNGNYEPTNCRWTTSKGQCNNMTTNVMIEYNGEKRTLKQWSEYFDLSYGMLKARRSKGIVPPELFNPPRTNRKNKRS